MKADVVIVGAGIIGLFTAWQLLEEGHSVSLLDRARPARESSWAGGGILSPLYPWRYPRAVHELARRSQAIYPDRLAALHEASGIDPEYRCSGLLINAVGDLSEAQAWAEAQGQAAEAVDARQARDIEPRLALSVHDALWMPRVGQVRNPRLARSLVEALKRAGVRFRPDTPVLGWQCEGDRVRAAQTPAGRIEAEIFIVASGAWSAGLLEPLGLHLPVRPVRGQMLLFRGEPDQLLRITLHEGRYAIPRRDGRILFGSTLEHAGFEKAVTSQALAELHGAATAMFPVLGELPIECHWAGLRPGTPDGVPVIGPHPRFTNLFINAGHFRNGVVLAPASAELLAAQLAGRATGIEVSPYLPESIVEKSA